MAAIIQRNDQNRGVWKAPAGTEAVITAEGLSLNPDNTEVNQLTSNGVNALRDLPGFGRVIWGARTLADSPEDRFLSSMRTQRWIMRCLERDLSDAALKVNGVALWSDLETRAGLFLNELFRQGAFAGETQANSYFVKCDSETTTASDIQAKRVNVIFGCAYLRSAEFVISGLSLQTFDSVREFPEVRMLLNAPRNGVMSLSYQTVPGFLHIPQVSASLQPGGWINGSSPASDGAWVTYEVPTISDRLLIRLKTERLPRLN